MKIELDKSGYRTFANITFDGSRFPMLVNFDQVEVTEKQIRESLESHKEFGFYDIISLIVGNASYHQEHTVNQDDVDKINAIITKQKERFEYTKQEQILSGDIIEIKVVKNDKLYTAHVEDTDGKIRVCTQAYAPHISKDLHCNTSGGYWQGLHAGSFLAEYKETRPKSFWTWGHCGCTGNGGVHFDLPVKVYVLSEKDCLKFY